MTFGGNASILHCRVHSGFLFTSTTTHTMSEPTIAQKAPLPVSVEAGKTYYWCSCGKSASQPFCDGAHKGSDFAPTPYTAEKDGTVYFCGCKHSGNGPLCDGAHKAL
jgi:CDGSH-type Zn-finger protein